MTKIVEIPVPQLVAAIAKKAKADAAAVAKQMKEHYESRADVQRFRTMTREEKVRQAKDIMVKNIKTYNDAMAGNDTSVAAAERKAEELANRMEREGK